MRQLIFLFILIPTLVFSQKKDYKTYDKAVKYFNEGKNEKAKQLIVKILDKNPDWNQPSLLISNILSDEGDITQAVQYLLNVYDLDNPEDVKGIEQIANLFYINGYYNDALEFFNIAWHIDSLSCKKKTSLYIENCNFAIQKIQDPVSFTSKKEINL